MTRLEIIAQIRAAIAKGIEPVAARVQLDAGLSAELYGKTRITVADLLAALEEPTYAPKRLAIFSAIDGERYAQDAQWGGPDHDRQHDRIDWVDFIEYQASHVDHMSETEAFTGRMTKIAALAVAAIEAAPAPVVEIDGVTRWPDGTVVYRIPFDGETPLYPAGFEWTPGATYAHVQAGGGWTAKDLFWTEAEFLASVTEDPVPEGFTRLVAQLPASA